MNTIQEEWDSFRKYVISQDAPKIQVDEMRRAFYSGSAIMAKLQLMITEMSEDAGVAVLEEIHMELIQFFKEMEDEK